MKHFWQKHWSALIVALLLTAMAGQMWWAAIDNGHTSDEQIHILSGYTTLTQHHALFDPEHPFLAKVIMAVPLLFVDLNVPTQAVNLDPQLAKPEVNNYSQANYWSYQLLFDGNNDAYAILLASRSMMILLTLALGLVLYLFSRHLFGKAAATLTVAVFAFEPNFIAHGSLANDDVAAALWIIATIFALSALLKKPTYKLAALTGFCLGLGLLTKFSLAILVPLICLLAFIWLRLHPSPWPLFARFKSNWQRLALTFALIGVTAWLVIWLAYGILIWLNPAQNPLPPLTFGKGLIYDLAAWVLPPMWVKGAALIAASANREGYFLGQCYMGSKWYYFPLLMFLKTPLGTLGLVGLGGGLAAHRFWQHVQGLSSASHSVWTRYLPRSFTWYLLLLPALTWLAVSAQSGFNIGYRHNLPVQAILLLLAGYVASLIPWHLYWAKLCQQPLITLSRLSLPSVIALLLSATIISVLMQAPNYLSYFNILAQEPRPIPYVANDSNVDWGQDIKELADFVASRNITVIAIDNFTGTGEIEYLNIPYTIANPADTTYRGYLAISRSAMVNHLCFRNNDWGWVINHHQPIAIVGNSINIYKIE